MGLSEMAANLGVSTEIGWSVLGISDNLDQDAILAAFSVGVSENFSAGVKYL